MPQERIRAVAWGTFMKFNLVHLLKIIVIETAYFFAIGFGYMIFSMLAFGEGANSFMYSKTNDVIFYCLLFIPQSIFNILKIKKYRETDKAKRTNYIISQIVVIGLIIYFFTHNHYW